MNGRDCTQFLQWSLPQLRMRWQGFRKVRGQVCKRIDRRMRELGLAEAAAYRSYLENNRDEWTVLDSLCRVTISRFYRDREVFHFIEREVLVKLSEAAVARGESELRCWSIGCASGEEPYTLAILWDLGAGRKIQGLQFNILATDANKDMIDRAQEGCYSSSSLADLPRTWQAIAFERRGGGYCVKAEQRDKIVFLIQDIRTGVPEGPFHLILCRNVAFTYFDLQLQKDILLRLKEKLVPGGVLIIGAHETLPAGADGFAARPGSPCVYWKKD